MKFEGLSFKSFMLASAALMASASPSLAQEAAQQFNIAPQALGPALNEFGRQSGRDILFSTEIVQGKQTRGVQGAHAPEDALRILLEGTNFTFHASADGTFMVQAPGSPTQLGDAAGAAPSEDTGVSEMLVIHGRPTLNADIRRTQDDAQPYVVFDAAAIQNAQSSNVEDFLKTHLSSNSVATTNAQAVGTSGLPNQSTFDLRGLGSDQTLVLVNGRRRASVTAGREFFQPNINGIPLTSIERIEVLPATAGGIYGGGATGGVINVVLKRDYSGLQFEESYANSFDTDVSTRRFDVSGGTSFFDGRTQLTFSASLQDGSDLLSGDREFARQSRALQLRNNPAPLLANFIPPSGATPNVMSVFGDNLVLDSGQALNSTFTSVPLGYAGPASDAGAALLSRAGQFNLDLPQDASANGTLLRLWQAPRVQTYSVSLRQELTENLEAFIDLSSERSQTNVKLTGGFGALAFLDGDAPNNPFTTPIWVVTSLPNFQLRNTSESELTNSTFGLIAQLPFNWSAELDYSETSSNSNSSYPGRGAFVPDSELVLRDLNAFPLDFASFTPAQLYAHMSIENTLKDTSLRFGGPLVTMPGGTATLSGLLEHRSEGFANAFEDDASVGLLTLFPHRSQSVDSAYVEARWPIVGGGNRMPLVRELELSTAVRHDAYNTESASNASVVAVPSRDGPFSPIPYTESKVSSTDYTIALRYVPVEGLTLRASYGTGFLPPSISQIGIVETFYTSDSFIPDPLRPGRDLGQEAPFTQISGGTADLRPEQSRSFSVGIIAQPTWLDGLRVSLDYTRIEKTDEIGSVTQQVVLAHPELFPGRITRGPNLPGDDPSWPGPVTVLDTSLVNFLSSTVSAIDAQASYHFRTDSFGEFDFYAIATYADRFEQEIGFGIPKFDRVGFLGGPLRLRGNVGLNWQQGAWSAGWNTQFYDSYLVYGADVGQSARDEFTLDQGSSRVPSQFYTDAYLRYRFAPTGPLKSAEIMVGIQNIFDQEPPIIASGVSTLGYAVQGDPRLRRFSVSFRQAF